jgi:hypothetical protein
MTTTDDDRSDQPLQRRDRRRREAQEDVWLAPLATRAADSRGREHP